MSHPNLRPGAFKGNASIKQQAIAQVEALLVNPEYLMGPLQPRDGEKLASNCIIGAILGVTTCRQAKLEAMDRWHFPHRITGRLIRLPPLAGNPVQFVKDALEAIQLEADLEAVVPKLKDDCTPDQFLQLLKGAEPIVATPKVAAPMNPFFQRKPENGKKPRWPIFRKLFAAVG